MERKNRPKGREPRRGETTARDPPRSLFEEICLTSDLSTDFSATNLCRSRPSPTRHLGKADLEVAKVPKQPVFGPHAVAKVEAKLPLVLVGGDAAREVVEPHGAGAELGAEQARHGDLFRV